MNRRRLNTGNVLLNLYFVIQYVLFIFILVYVLFPSTSLRPLQLIVFESLKQHDETSQLLTALCFLQGTEFPDADLNRIHSEHEATLCPP